ncbi:hypothetical protein M9Y10_043515 [Tritrichomonas musculus]|uniref:Initiator binding domain-containing protein n=1 Tax=Tritrichomonas musculus TaxID=1915356 RepID=A0ABR2K2T4_9EUKA
MYIEQFPSAMQSNQVDVMPPQRVNPSTGYPDPLLYKLPISNQIEYFHLVNMFAYADDRNKRNLGMTTFIKHLSMIHAFVCRGDSYDALRGMLCGIEFGLNSFLINTGKMKKLMYRSKSCMNGCFQKLGYNVCRPPHDILTLFSQILPGIPSHLLTARQWCVRRASENSQLSFIPNIKVEIATPLNADPTPETNSSSTPSSPVSPPPPPVSQPTLLSHKSHYCHSAPSSLPSNFGPPPSSYSQQSPLFLQQGYTSQMQFPSLQQSPMVVSQQQQYYQPSMQINPNRNPNTSRHMKSYSTRSSVGSLPIKAPPLFSTEEVDPQPPSLLQSNEQKEEQPQFMFDITTLLNHQTEEKDIPRMILSPLSQLSC